MPNDSAIELIDRNYGLLKAPRNLRSIRFKGNSFSATSRAWNKFRAALRKYQINRAESKLEKAQDEFADMQIKAQDMRVDNNEVIQQKIVEKAKAIALLEERLNILRNIPPTAKFADNRAIKLKDIMMNNARSNSYNAYSIFKENPSNESISLAADYPDKIVESETSKTAENVQKILSEKSFDAESSQVRDDVLVVPDRDEIKKILDGEFEKQESNYGKTISAEEVADAINQKFEEKEPEKISHEEVAEVVGEKPAEPVVDREVIKAAVEDAINEIDVSKNGTSKANIERYVNPNDGTYVHDDGSYRLTRNEIDEDFRKTYINEEPVKPKETYDEKGELSIPKIDFSKIFKPVEEENNEMPFTKEDSKMNENVRLEGDSIKDITQAIDRVESKDEIQALLERIKALKLEQNASKKRALEAKEKVEESEVMKREAQERLQAYGQALEEDLNYNNKSAEELIQKAKSNEELAETMLSMIQPSANEEELRRNVK